MLTHNLGRLKSTSAGCEVKLSQCESPHQFACPPVPTSNIPNLICMAFLKKYVDTPTQIREETISVACDLGGSKCKSPHLSAWSCMVTCHPVLIGNIPDLICVNLIKKHAGTPIWEDCTSVYQCSRL